MRVVGLDIHRIFAEAVMLEDGRVTRLGRVGMTRDHLAAFARTLTHDDAVVIEATGNASAVAEVIRPHVGRVVIANPRQVRLIAEARIKTDVIDATVLARLYASWTCLGKVESSPLIQEDLHAAAETVHEGV